jgi:cell wall-associated NlpC family hydrolase
MRKILTIIAVMFIVNVSAQTNKSYTDFKLPAITDDILTPDTLLNNFMLKWIGKPYKLGGKTEKGIDCSQFNKRLYKDVYNKDLENVAYKQYNQTQRIKRDSLQIGDLIFFRSKASPSGWHTGVFIGNTYFIHAANRFEGVKVSSLEEPRYKKAIRGYGTLPKKDDSEFGNIKKF